MRPPAEDGRVTPRRDGTGEGYQGDAASLGERIAPTSAYDLGHNERRLAATATLRSVRKARTVLHCLIRCPLSPQVINRIRRGDSTAVPGRPPRQRTVCALSAVALSALAHPCSFSVDPGPSG